LHLLLGWCAAGRQLLLIRASVAQRLLLQTCAPAMLLQLPVTVVAIAAAYAKLVAIVASCGDNRSSNRRTLPHLIIRHTSSSLTRMRRHPNDAGKFDGFGRLLFHDTMRVI
jgi:hypothetical protein